MREWDNRCNYNLRPCILYGKDASPDFVAARKYYYKQKTKTTLKEKMFITKKRLKSFGLYLKHSGLNYTMSSVFFPNRE